MQPFEQCEQRDRGCFRQRDHAFAVTRAVEHGLEVLAHRADRPGADVERIVDDAARLRRAQPDCVAQIGYVEQLVRIVARTEHRKVVTGVGPVEQQFERAEALGTDECLRAQDRHAQAAAAEIDAELLAFDLGFAVRPDSRAADPSRRSVRDPEFRIPTWTK